MKRSGLEELVLQILKLKAGQPRAVPFSHPLALTLSLHPCSCVHRNRCWLRHSILPPTRVTLFSSLSLFASTVPTAPTLRCCCRLLLAGVTECLVNLSDMNAISLPDGMQVSNSDVFDLTPLGQHLARLPTDVKIGKLIIFGSFLRCVGKHTQSHTHTHTHTLSLSLSLSHSCGLDQTQF